MTPATYLAQRLTGALLAPLVAVHLGLIIYAVQGELTGEEILSRTRGSIGFAVFYTVFVVAAAIHAGIGVINIVREWTGFAATTAYALGGLVAAGLLLLGLRAVAGVF